LQLFEIKLKVLSGAKYLGKVVAAHDQMLCHSGDAESG
jgi:hypothetical protein